MPTFQRTETVDARQFTGGKENGLDIALWVNAQGKLTETRAEYMPEIKAAMKDHPEYVRIRNYVFRTSVYQGDWVILRQDGRFDHLRPQEFEAAGYKQV